MSLEFKMGGSGTTAREANEFGKIELTFGQNYFLAGESVVGTVILTAIKELHVSKLEVELIGTEETSCYRSKQVATIIHRRAVLEEGDANAGAVAGLPKSLDVGAHEYRYSLSTQGVNVMPSTCLYKSSLLRCQVSYVVIAKLFLVHQTVPVLVVCRSVQILEKLRARTNKQVHKLARVKNTKSDKGSATLKARVNCSALLVPLGFELYVDYDNSDCSCRVDRLTLSVNEEVTVHAKGGDIPVLEENVVSRWTLPGLDAHAKAFYNRLLQFEQNSVSLRAESSQGVNFSISYVLHIVPHYAWRACVEKPVIELPVQVTAKTQTRLKDVVPRDLPSIPEVAEEGNRHPSLQLVPGVPTPGEYLGRLSA